MTLAAVDTNLLVAVIDGRDKWHQCRDLNVQVILSFDADFDKVDWLRRVS